jgi:hypothetical protein
MTPNDLAKLSSEEFVAFIIAHFEREGYALEECRPAPAGQLLLFQLKGMRYVAYCLSDKSLFGPVTSVEVAWGVTEAKIQTAACGYIITRSRFYFGAEMEARGSGIEIVLVDGEALKRWIL